MFEVDANNAAEYLFNTGHIAARGDVVVRELSGGVSNIVLLVEPRGGDPFVVKQAREKLRVPQPWFCSVARVLREIQVLRICDRILGSEQTPRLLFADEENFLFAMSAAPSPHTTWKTRLLAGETDDAIAAQCGHLLGRLHGETWLDPRVASDLDDRQFFDDLRLDPYYRQVARVRPDFASAMERLVDSVWQHRRCLVHGDFSPKNLLVWNAAAARPAGLMLIDFEVGHFGDPAFDLGFFLTHLTLKAIWAGPRGTEYLRLIERFGTKYSTTLAARVSPRERIALEQRAALNWAGCCLARVDGKSGVDYPVDAERVRRLARTLLDAAPTNWDAALAIVTQAVLNQAAVKSGTP